MTDHDRMSILVNALNAISVGRNGMPLGRYDAQTVAREAMLKAGLQWARREKVAQR